MKQRIKLGVIVILRSRITIIFMACILVCQLMLMFQLNIQSQSERIESYSKYLKHYTIFYDQFWDAPMFKDYYKKFFNFTDKDIENMNNKYNYLNKNTKTALNSLMEEDYLEFYKSNIKANIVLADTIVENQKEQKMESDVNCFKDIDKLEKIKHDWNLPTYSLKPTLDVLDMFWAPQYISQTIYSYEMLEREIDEFYTPSFFNGNTALYQYISNLFPIMILVLIIFLFYNQYEKDKRTGTIKNRMIQPQKRIFYLIENIITNFIVIVIVLTVPTLISNILACLFYGMDFVNIPILAYPDGITSFKSIPMSLTDESSEFIQTMGFTLYSGYPTLDYNGPHVWTKIMDFHVFMVFVVGMLLLFILFNVILNQFITTLFRNPHLSLVVNLVVAGICFSIVSIGDTSTLGMWNPYSYANPIVNLAGTSYYTYAMGICVLSLYCVVLFLLSAIILRKKDVA